MACRICSWVASVDTGPMAAVSADGVLVATGIRVQQATEHWHGGHGGQTADSMGEACVNLLPNTVWVSRSQILACIRTNLCDFDQLLCSRINFGCISRAVRQTLCSCNL
jgi:hypothetical protein